MTFKRCILICCSPLKVSLETVDRFQNGKKSLLRCLLEDHEIWRVLYRRDEVFDRILRQRDLFGRM